MARTETPVCDFGAHPPDFCLTGTDGRPWTLQDCRGPKGLLVMFICNHCPYVQAIRSALARDCHELIERGIGCVAIQPNDTVAYPEDGLERMAEVAEQERFPFPYLLDETQDVARAYGAVCTPDFFGYNADLGLQYRGRFDASGQDRSAGPSSRDLFEAMIQVADTGEGPREQVPSVGCSIKWK